MRRIALALVGLIVATTVLAVSEHALIKGLPERWKVWLEEEIYPLITSEQRKAFLKLVTDAERQAFAEQMWTVWAGENEVGPAFRRIYEDRVQDARELFDNTIEDRSRVFLLHGASDVRTKVDCDTVFNPMEIWQWGRLPGLGRDVVVIFYKPYGLGQFRLWDPTIDGRNALYTTQGINQLDSWRTGPSSQYRLARPEYRCSAEVDILRVMEMAAYWMNDLKTKQAMQHVPLPPGSGGNESVSQRFLEFSTVAPEGAQAFEFDFTATVGTRRGGKVAVSFAGTVPRVGLTSSKIGKVEVVKLDVTGLVSREGGMVDRFRYAFTFPAASSEFPIVIERELRPGVYTIRIKVADENSNRAAVKEHDVKVEAPELPAPSAAEVAGNEAVDKVAKAQEATLLLRGPEGDGVSGVHRFAALTGPAVSRVDFLLDNRLILGKNKPPFEVDLDLGPVPRLAAVVAVAFDAGGKEIDRKQVDLNVGRERFFVRLQPISAADRQGSKVRAVVTVNVPTDRTLKRVDLFWNEGLALSLYAPPFIAWLPVTDDGSIGYLRALAVLSDGGEAEDVRFVNAPQFLTGLQVQTVELPVTVLDKRGKPVEGMRQGDFEVSEDGRPQKISHFSLQQELPIRLGLVLDTSGSMEKTLPEVQRVVSGFLKDLLRPKDRAFVVAFSDRPQLLEGFSADFPALERALIALRAAYGTALYDSTVFGLFQFSGVRGRKALILLTDGEDNASRMDYDKTLDYARRSGVTIFTIGIDLPVTKVGIRSQLTRLARTTGGDAFFLPRGASLDPVVGQINRELRSQYLLAYTSDSEAASDLFRKIALKVKRPGVEVRTLAGYYPGN